MTTRAMRDPFGTQDNFESPQGPVRYFRLAALRSRDRTAIDAPVFDQNPA